jgi:hypothetical protein
VDILIDGVDLGVVSPVSAYAGEYYDSEQYGLTFRSEECKRATHGPKMSS